MKTKTKEPDQNGTAVTDAPLQLPALPTLDKQQVQHVKVKLITPSPFQPRKEFDEEEMTNLRDSVRANGIRIPLLGRPKPKGDGIIELVAGERRFRCADALKLETVPMIVQDLTDAEVIRIQRLENGARENLKALEAAEDYVQLEKQGKSIDEICTLYGVKRSHVFTRKRVAKLPDEIKKLIREGKLAITIGDLVAKLPTPEIQAEAAKEFGGGVKDYDTHPPTIVPYAFRQAQNYIAANFQCDLDKAPFDLKKLYSGDVKRKGSTLMLASRGSCAECKFRSGNCKELYPELKSANVCTEPDCYAGKVKADTEEKLASAKAKGQQILAPETSRKLFPSYSSGDSPVYGSGYKTLADTCGEDDKDRTYAQLLKGQALPQAYAVLNNQGAAKTVYKEKDLEAALKKAGHKFIGRHDEANEKYRAENAKRKAEQDARGKVLAVIVPQVRAKAEKLAATPAGQLKLLRWLIDELDEQFYNTKTTDKADKLQLAPAWGLLATLVCEEDAENVYHDYPTCITAMCDLLGMDLKAEEKKLTAAAKPEPSPVKKAKATKANKGKAKK